MPEECALHGRRITCAGPSSDCRQCAQKFHPVGDTPTGGGIESRTGLVALAGLRTRGVVACRNIARTGFSNWFAVGSVLIQQGSEEALLLTGRQSCVDACNQRCPEGCGGAGAAIGRRLSHEYKIVERFAR